MITTVTKDEQSAEDHTNNNAASSTRTECLLNNADFMLVYVPPATATDGTQRGIMRIVRPASDPTVQQRLRRGMLQGDAEAAERDGFYALSHLWGQDPFKDMWNEVGDFIHDESGEPVEPIPMRPEKRETVIAMLRAYPDSYWWIDMLCARSDTPPVIMTDIYSLCSKCIALFDNGNQLDFGAISGVRLRDVGYHLDYPDIYTSDTESFEVAKYTEIFEIWNTEWQLLTALFNGRWWDRVWTLQEMALPSRLDLIPETGGAQGVSQPIDGKELVVFLKCAKFFAKRNELGDFDGACADRTSARLCDKWKELIHGEFKLPKTKQASPSPQDCLFSRHFVFVLRYLANCPRQCVDPRDYVYGVLGLLVYDIARMDNARDVWNTFLSHLQKDLDIINAGYDQMETSKIVKISLTDRARTVNLEKATCLADVYSGIMEMTYASGVTEMV